MSTDSLIESYYIERFKEGQALAESGSFHYAGTLSVRVYFTRNSLVVEVVKVTFFCSVVPLTPEPFNCSPKVPFKIFLAGCQPCSLGHQWTQWPIRGSGTFTRQRNPTQRDPSCEGYPQPSFWRVLGIVSPKLSMPFHNWIYQFKYSWLL